LHLLLLLLPPLHLLLRALPLEISAVRVRPGSILSCLFGSPTVLLNCAVICLGKSGTTVRQPQWRYRYERKQNDAAAIQLTPPEGNCFSELYAADRTGKVRFGSKADTVVAAPISGRC